MSKQCFPEVIIFSGKGRALKVAGKKKRMGKQTKQNKKQKTKTRTKIKTKTKQNKKHPW